jgi:hypothetical protein
MLSSNSIVPKPVKENAKARALPEIMESQITLLPACRQTENNKERNGQFLAQSSDWGIPAP